MVETRRGTLQGNSFLSGDPRVAQGWRWVTGNVQCGNPVGHRRVIGHPAMEVVKPEWPGHFGTHDIGEGVASRLLHDATEKRPEGQAVIAH